MPSPGQQINYEFRHTRQVAAPPRQCRKHPLALTSTHVRCTGVRPFLFPKSESLPSSLPAYTKQSKTDRLFLLYHWKITLKNIQKFVGLLLHDKCLLIGTTCLYEGDGLCSESEYRLTVSRGVVFRVSPARKNAFKTLYMFNKRGMPMPRLVLGKCRIFRIIAFAVYVIFKKTLRGRWKEPIPLYNRPVFTGEGGASSVV